MTDARAIAEIAVRGWQAAYRGILPDEFLDGLSVTAREAGWRDLLEGDAEVRTPAWLAELGGRRVGFVSSGPPRDEDVAAPAAEIYAIYVLPDSWRRGVGRMLLRTAVAHWQAAGVDRLVLWVLRDNARARGFYESMGWRADGAEQPLTIGDVSVREVRYLLANEQSAEE